jgi:hypothetical protein
MRWRCTGWKKSRKPFSIKSSFCSPEFFTLTLCRSTLWGSLVARGKCALFSLWGEDRRRVFLCGAAMTVTHLLSALNDILHHSASCHTRAGPTCPALPFWIPAKNTRNDTRAIRLSVAYLLPSRPRRFSPVGEQHPSSFRSTGRPGQTGCPLRGLPVHRPSLCHVACHLCKHRPFKHPRRNRDSKLRNFCRSRRTPVDEALRQKLFFA